MDVSDTSPVERVSILHQGLAGWRGVSGCQLAKNDVTRLKGEKDSLPENGRESRYRHSDISCDKVGEYASCGYTMGRHCLSILV